MLIAKLTALALRTDEQFSWERFADMCRVDGPEAIPVLFCTLPFCACLPDIQLGVRRSNAVLIDQPGGLDLIWPQVSKEREPAISVAQYIE